MSDAILLKDEDIKVDPKKIGISYSGGGPLVVVELGVAQAFIDAGIIPNVISGASAGAIASTAHALDVRGGKGIAMAVDLLSRVTNSVLLLDPIHFAGRLLMEREHLPSVGDNGPIGPLIKAGMQMHLGLSHVTTKTFTGDGYPKLMLVATDVVTRSAVWFSDDSPSNPVNIEDVLIASSAIPGIFPWKPLTVEGQERLFVDGGVVSNQPLSNLVNQGCGTIYACAVGPATASPPPANGLENAMRAVNLAMHQCTKLEEDYVRLKMQEAGTGVVHHIHPEIDIPLHGFDFTPELVRQVVEEARTKTSLWLGQIQAGKVQD
jgi:NTE family protein